jgi:hypothetical protein
MSWTVDFLMSLDGQSNEKIASYLDLLTRLAETSDMFEVVQTRLYRNSTIPEMELARYEHGNSKTMGAIARDISNRKSGAAEDTFVLETDVIVRRKVNARYSEAEDRFDVVDERIKTALYHRESRRRLTWYGR